jgi:hypothetical protein
MVRNKEHCFLGIHEDCWLFLFILLLIMMLTACGTVSYHSKAADGSTTDAWGMRIGTDEVIKSFDATTTPESRSVTIGSIDSNQSKGMKQLNSIVESIVEGAVKGAK